MNDVLLIFPPLWEPSQPYLSTATLVAYLRHHGYGARQVDANLEFFCNRLHPEFIRGVLPRLKHKIDILERRPVLDGDAQKQYDVLVNAHLASGPMMSLLPDALAFFRSPNRFYDFNGYVQAKKVLNRTIEIISASCFPTQVSFNNVVSNYSDEHLDEIMLAVSDSNENPFLNFYLDRLAAWMGPTPPSIVGLSITGTSQIIPGLTLARLIKHLYPGTHLVLGGSIVTRWEDVLERDMRLHESFFHSAVLYEGEKPLLELVEAVRGNRSMESVANLIHHHNGTIVHNPLSEPAAIDELPPPDFDGLRLDDYFSPVRVLPYLSSRGCYWNKCAFCDHSHIYDNRYRPRTLDRVIADLTTLKATYHTQHFSFSDEAIAPARLKQISDKLVEEKVGIEWNADARFEPYLTQEGVCDALYRGGCRLLFFGLESACDRVLNLMNKGTSTQRIVEVCTHTARAGIWNHHFLFFGFPGETEAEAQQTIDFTLAHRDVIHSMGSGSFTLGKEPCDSFMTTRLLTGSQPSGRRNCMTPMCRYSRNRCPHTASGAYSTGFTCFYTSVITALRG